MRLYSCKVLLGGSPFNEVSKTEVTVPEMIVLRHIHNQGEKDGGAAGVEVLRDVKRIDGEATIISLGEDGKPVKKPRSDKQERARLKELYDPDGRKNLIDRLFGVAGTLPDTADFLDEPVVDEPVRRTAPRRKTDDGGLGAMME